MRCLAKKTFLNLLSRNQIGPGGIVKQEKGIISRNRMQSKFAGPVPEVKPCRLSGKGFVRRVTVGRASANHRDMGQSVRREVSAMTAACQVNLRDVLHAKSRRKK